ncbi:unnamed protein product [Hyaloperonospora brassicae]|uniref:Uncharacterized protein n=1 Tax=Hyaloperonospora brassicae TaxID=162125 RepID=A0AAV0T6G1_HYABA|nr:unnamed protein product [Hyaloperonospora brassicae]
MRPLSLLFVAAVGASLVSAADVLVLGKSTAPLWHKTRSSSSFSGAGLTNLALHALGLPSGRHVPSSSAALSPLQADLFTHSEVYAMLLLDGLSTASLEAIDAALHDVDAFHDVYPVEDSPMMVPVTVANSFHAKYPQAVYCAGTQALCSSVGVQAASEVATVVQQVLAANSFLSPRDDADVAFATQVAQVMQLTADMKQHKDGKMLYVVGLSSLQGHKQELAEQLVTATVTEFLDQLMKKELPVAAQVMTGSLPDVMSQVTAVSRRARTRRLVSHKAKKKEESEESESGADDNEEDDAASGSVGEDDANATLASNSSAPGAVSMPDIAHYQIILWTSILLGAMLLMSVLAMANMDAGRDSLLYAKFIADVNGRKTN